MITQYRFVIIYIVAMLIFTTNAIAQNITIVAPVKGENFIDGYEYVDLGLSVKWATCNIGAENSWDYGDYYSWGENETKDIYWSKTYKYCSGDTDSCIDIGEKYLYGDKSEYYYHDISSTQYDVAYTKWGKHWRMPTIWETRELENKCKWIWEEVNGIKGARVIGPNGNSIFLPATGAKKGNKIEHRGQHGYYWTSINYSNEYGYATYLGVSQNSREYDTQFFQNYRFQGYAIRPVSK